MFFYFQAILLKSIHWRDMLRHIPTCEQGWIYCPQMCEKWVVFVFYVLVSKETRAFMLKHLRLGLSIYQVMNKQNYRVEEMMENSGELSRDLFLSEQDICNLVGKLGKKTYKKHEFDA